MSITSGISNILRVQQGDDEDPPADYDSTISIFLDQDGGGKKSWCTSRRLSVLLLLLLFFLGTVAGIRLASPNSGSSGGSFAAQSSPETRAPSPAPTLSKGLVAVSSSSFSSHAPTATAPSTSTPSTSYRPTTTTRSPSISPTVFPTKFPSSAPTSHPTPLPSHSPTAAPTRKPTVFPTTRPTVTPTVYPTLLPTISPTYRPTTSPTPLPSPSPSTRSPTIAPVSAGTFRCFETKQELKDAVNRYTGEDTAAAVYVTSVYGPIAQWCVSRIKNFSTLFAGKTSFNEPLDGWDVSNAFTIRSMFENAYSFNQDISMWNVSQVHDMGVRLLSCVCPLTCAGLDFMGCMSHFMLAGHIGV